MKKFSKITNVKVNEEPKSEKAEMSDLEELRMRIHMILENNLSVGASGPIHQVLQGGTVRVEGKERVIQSIMDMFDEISNKKTIKLLESMKSHIGDHKIIDSKIMDLKDETFLKNDPVMKNLKTRIKNLSERYSDDGEFKKVMSLKASKMPSSAMIAVELTDIPKNRKRVVYECLRDQLADDN